MFLRRIQALILGAVAVSPASLFAQDPMAPPASQTQPNQPGQVPSGTTSMPDSNTGGDTVQRMRDKSFLRKATEGSLAEVQFGKLATEKSTSDDVKSFGQKMIDEHTKLNEKIASIADSLGVMLPKRMSKEDQAEYDKLNTLSGDEFDKEYITAMVKNHHANLREFRIEANSTTDPGLKDAITDGATLIHDHMVIIDKIARAKGIATPAGRAKPAAPPAT